MRSAFRFYLCALLLVAFAVAASASYCVPANISVAGKVLKLSPGAEYESGRAFAPLSFLESLGAIYHQSRNPGNISITFSDGSTGEAKTVTRAKSEYIDIQDIVKLIGAQVAWDSAGSTYRLTPVVRSVSYEDSTVTISAGIPVKYSVNKWSGKLIVDVQNTAVSQELLKSGSQSVESDYIERIRTGMYNKTTARIVLDLKKDAPYAVLSSTESSNIAVRIGAAKPSDSQPAPVTSRPGSVSVIESAEILDVDGNSFDLSINVSSKAKIGSLVDTKTGTISLNIPNARLADGFVVPADKHQTLRYIKFTDVPGSPSKVKVDIVLNRVMMVETAAYEGSIAVSVRPYKQSTGSLEQKIIVVDPGHGGNQPGAIGGGVKEKEVNLAIARKLSAALRQTGATVIMTRETDTAVDLGSRPQVAVDNAAHFFISIHCNSNSFPNSISGTETYYHGWNPSSIYLAKLIQPAVCAATEMKDRGARSDRRDASSSGFKVLRLLDSTDIPAVLLETGYLNSSSDRAKLIDPVFQGKLVEGIVEGLKSYIAGECTK